MKFNDSNNQSGCEIMRFIINVRGNAVFVPLLAVLAVHHPHLPANFILQLCQQQRVCMGHSCTLL